MPAPSTQYPPPLSSPPTVESLEHLLDGLHQPLHRGVPLPPAVDTADGPLVDEHPVGVVAPPEASVSPAPPAAAPSAAPPTTSNLTWAADAGGDHGLLRHWPWLAVVVAAAVAVAAGTGLL